jgi:hypothetical protein
MEPLISLSDWLAATSLSEGLATRLWVVPTLQSIHIMAIGVILASSAMLNMRIAGIIDREQSLRELAVRFYPWIWGALGVLVITGILQIMAEPHREFLNWLFWTKMGLLLAALACAAPVRRLVEDCRYRDLAPGKRRVLRACALISLALWIAIIACGRWIAYAGEMAI